MDDFLPELEAELRRMVPRAPRPQVEARLAAELKRRPARAEVRYVWWALPIAAALALLAARWSPPTAMDERTVPGERFSSSDARFRPVAAENLLVSSKDEGVVVLADGTPARQVRMGYLDTITWKNPTTNASLSWTFPREEVRVVPVSYQ